jgi:hypothetical protein
LPEIVDCGARTVFIGRPVLWGLASGAEAGVRYVLEMVRQEFESAQTTLLSMTCKTAHPFPFRDSKLNRAITAGSWRAKRVSVVE